MQNAEQKAREWIEENMGMSATIEQLASLTNVIKEYGYGVKNECYSSVFNLDYQVIDDFGELVGRFKAGQACLTVELL